MNKYAHLSDAGRFAADCVDPVEAEFVLTRSLKYADEYLGARSSTSILILLDLLDFYKRSGNEKKVDEIRDRLENETFTMSKAALGLPN